jgi:hypothetical protein
MIRPFPCVRLAPTQTGLGVGERSANYVNLLYPLSDISIITKYFLGA